MKNKAQDHAEIDEEKSVLLKDRIQFAVLDDQSGWSISVCNTFLATIPNRAGTTSGLV
jgi:hypothetical protein